jgi:electron transfer flavoprotein beta subunit
MKIVVAIKQVPARDSQLQLNAAASWIDETHLAYEINEPDAYAVEAAVRLKESLGSGEVVAISAGPERAGAAIREALAQGADRAIHVVVDDLNEWDALGMGRLLAAAIAPESPDLVLTGLQSDDLGAGQTGVILAELLGLPHATLAMSLEAAGGGIRVKRELEGGWFQRLALPCPALVTVQSGISKLRYVTLLGIKRAKTKTVQRVTPAELGVAPRRKLTLLRLHTPVSSKRTRLLTGTLAEQAQALVEALKHEVPAL